MSWHKLIPALLGLALLGGCGFQPMYARGPVGPGGPGGVTALLDTVGVAVVRPTESRDARVAQVLRNELLDRISPHGEPANPRYQLHVVLDSEVVDLLVRRDSTVSRARINMTATYQLLEGETRVESGSARAMTGFDLPPEGYFASVASARDGEQQAAVLIAEQITAALSAHFARRGAAAQP
jgi:LPS-assembly lipoprotein